MALIILIIVAVIFSYCRTNGGIIVRCLLGCFVFYAASLFAADLVDELLVFTAGIAMGAEGQPGVGPGWFGGSYGAGAQAFFALLREWREQGSLEGLELR